MNDWFSGDVISNGIRLHYYRTGGDKPALVLCHGITDSGLCWLRTTQVLQKDFDIIMVDARGHGLSEAPAQGYGVAHHAADIAGLIQALELDQPYMMGHSMGAATTANVLANHPQLVKRAVLEDPPWRDRDMATDMPAARAASAQEWSDRIVERYALSLEELTARGKIDNPKWHDLEFGPWSEAKHKVSRNAPNFIIETVTPWRETAAKITTPSLLVTGDEGEGAIVTTAIAAEVSRTNPAITVAHIAGAGHNIRRDRFEAFIATVAAFLQD